MARKIKPLIYVFCEGESEIEYTKYLKEKFEDVAVIQKPVKGLFEVADKKFKKDAKYRNNAEVTDEIWFFFDVDDGQTGSWDRIQKIVSTLKKLRKKPNIRVRLLMTTGCVEFWFLLHYKKVVPSIQTVAEKENVLRLLQNECPGYVKGDSNTTRKIADHFKQASINGDWVLGQIEGLPTSEDSYVRDRWFYKILYMIFDYSHKHYTFKQFEV